MADEIPAGVRIYNAGDAVHKKNEKSAWTVAHWDVDALPSGEYDVWYVLKRRNSFGKIRREIVHQDQIEP